MKKKIAVRTLCAMLFALSVLVHAQQPKKLFRVGYLSPAASPSIYGSQMLVEAFTESLRALGYVEGQNILIERRFTKRGDTSQFSGLADELVRLKVDCIVTTGIPAIRAAKQATSTIPIVMNVADDPVEMGLIESLARPGGNITGYTRIDAELSGKRLEILKEAFPKVARVGHLWTGLSGMANVREIEAPARALRLQVKAIEMKGPDDLEKSFRTAAKEAEALIISGGSWMNDQRARVASQAAKTRLPAIYPNSQFIVDGGLMSYNAAFLDQHRRMAYYVDRILKGAKPADLPVERPNKFEFVVNLKAAKQIGLTIPQSLLYRATK